MAGFWSQSEGGGQHLHECLLVTESQRLHGAMPVSVTGRRWSRCEALAALSVLFGGADWAQVNLGNPEVGSFFRWTIHDLCVWLEFWCWARGSWLVALTLAMPEHLQQTWCCPLTVARVNGTDVNEFSDRCPIRKTSMAHATGWRMQ